MKNLQRCGAILLALTILLGLLPSQVLGAASSTLTGLPTADVEELVVEYGKPVNITLARLKQMVYTNPKTSISDLAGALLSGTHGNVLKSAPADMSCTTVGNAMTTSQGTLTRTSVGLSFTPSEFMSDIETVYVVLSLEGCKDTSGVSYTHIVVAVRIIPATSMYYEAEDYLGTAISAFDTTDGGTTTSDWGVDDDGTGSGDQIQQTNTTDTVCRDMVVNRENIPAGAFFSDFDGKGNSVRYSKDVIYNGCNFDTVNYWNGNETDSIDTNSGTMTLTFKSGKTYHYAQTVTNGGGLATKPLFLRPGSNDFFQIRFRIENCEKTTKPTLTLCYLWGKNDSGGDTADTTDANTILENLDADELNAGHYITVTIPLSKDSYTKATALSYFRFSLGGVSYSKTNARMIIDYVYFGPESGLMLPPVKTGNYLFFGFDRTTEDSRFATTPYGGSSSESTNYNSASNWSLESTTTTSKSIVTTAPGYIKFTDNATWSSGNGMHYNYVQTGASTATHNLKYTPTSTDIFRVRFKISGGKQLSNNDSYDGECCVRLEAGITGSTSTVLNIGYGTKNFDLASAQADYIIVDIPVYNNSNYKGLISGNKKIGSLRPVFNNVDGKGTAIFYVDYFYLGPKELADQVTKTENYLFMDFTNTTPDKYRYENRSYGWHNYDLATTVTTDANKQITPTVSSKCMVLTPTSDYTGNIFFYASGLRFTPLSNHYFQMRFKVQKIDSAVPITANGTPNVAIQLRNQDNTTFWSAQKDIAVPAVNKWITVTIPLNKEEYKNSTQINRIAPAVRGLKGAKVIIDYVYVGCPIWYSSSGGPNPTHIACPATESLYFGFGNTGSDSSRYKGSSYSCNYAYGAFNYDTTYNKANNVGYWATHTSYSDTTTSWSIDNTLGVAKVNVTASPKGTGTPGPYFATTATPGTYSFADTNKSLNYCPQYAEVFQIRLRLNGCTVTSGKKPELVFLFGGYDETGGSGGSSAEYGYVTYSKTEKYPYARKTFADNNNFQVITIPLSADIRNMSLITNFGIRFWNMKGGNIDIDYIYIGPGADAPEPVYGNDSSYDNDVKHSNGKSLFVHGTGVKLKENPDVYSEASFTFTGTGFDIISRTGKEQGAIRVEVTKVSDGSLVKSMTVNKKGETELYQIPVVSITGLPHGTYKVSLWANKQVKSSYDFLYRGDEFYLDAVRIYDPVDVTAATLSGNQQLALNAYRYHKESLAYVREIRDTLLTEADFKSNNFTTATSNALLVDAAPLTGSNQDYASDVEISGNLALTVGTYNQVGPKNEVYLSPGQAVAFKLKLATDQVPVSIDIGAKTVRGVSGESAVLAAGLVTSASSGTLTANSETLKTITTATAMYYPLNISGMSKDTTYYLILHNASAETDPTKNILSLTDLKICYNTAPTGQPSDDYDNEILSNSLTEEKPETKTTEETTSSEPYRFEVDDRTMKAAAVFLNSLYETPVESEVSFAKGLKFYHSLNLASDISVNFMVPTAVLEEYDEFTMEFLVESYEGNEFMGYKCTYPKAEKNGDYYYFTLENLNATQMNDEIGATLYLTKDGKEYVSETDIYSIGEYAYAQLGKSDVSESLKTLCADLLVYGAKAQLFKGYRTDALADMAMTEEERGYCTDLSAVTFGNHNQVLSDLDSPMILWKGKTLTLDSRVSIRYILDLSSYEGTPEELSLRLTYTDYTGELQTAILTGPSEYLGEAGWYSFSFDGLTAAELRSVVDAAVFCGETQVSRTLRYSADTYGNGKSSTLLDLCKALFAYSDSAKAYFMSAE